MLWYILFNSNYSIALFAQDAKTAKDLLGRIKLAYENVPMWMQQGVEEWNKENIKLENNAEIIASATSASAARGRTFNFILLDEFAHVENNLADEFISSVFPTITSGQTTKLTLVSTPKGMNHFYKMWMDACEKRSEFIPHEITWRDVPGRDDEWAKNQIEFMGSADRFAQEMEGEFLGGEHTLIRVAALRNVPIKSPMKKDNGIDVYYEPKPGHMYILSADTSEGKKQNYSAFTVFDITSSPYTAVAKYRSNEVTTAVYPMIILQAAKYYNEAFVLFENNSVGMYIGRTLLDELNYENILTSVHMGKNGIVLSIGRGELGLRTTVRTKSIGCVALKDLIENEKLVFHDFDTLQEFSNFIQKGTTFQADEGCSDDLVMGYVFFAWASTQEFFYELNEMNIHDVIRRNYDDDLLPFHIDQQGEDEPQPGPGGWVAVERDWTL